jgi:hypothetical protein
MLVSAWLLDIKYCRQCAKMTHSLVVRVADLLAHELAHPVVTGAAFLGHHAGDYKRHLRCACGCKCSFREEALNCEGR